MRTAVLLAFATALFVPLAANCVGGSGGASGSSSGNGGQCIENGSPCGPKPDVCVGDCKGNTCCSGLCAGSTCTASNVTFAATCPASPCGGDPSGSWHFVGACVSGGSACDGGSGAYGASTTLQVAATGTTTDVVFETDIHSCGYISTGGGNSINGRWVADAGALGSLGGNPYCVQGSSLWVFPNASDWHQTVALEFSR
jgi:hypothetical protein